MSGAMVTARMSATKKEAGNRILERLGSNASQAINELYDYLIERSALPWQEDRSSEEAVDKGLLAEALDWVDGLQVNLSPEFASMDIADARRHRLGIG